MALVPYDPNVGGTPVALYDHRRALASRDEHASTIPGEYSAQTLRQLLTLLAAAVAERGPLAVEIDYFDTARGNWDRALGRLHPVPGDPAALQWHTIDNQGMSIQPIFQSWPVASVRYANFTTFVNVISTIHGHLSQLMSTALQVANQAAAINASTISIQSGVHEVGSLLTTAISQQTQQAALTANQTAANIAMLHAGLQDLGHSALSSTQQSVTAAQSTLAASQHSLAAAQSTAAASAEIAAFFTSERERFTTLQADHERIATELRTRTATAQAVEAALTRREAELTLGVARSTAAQDVREHELRQITADMDRDRANLASERQRLTDDRAALAARAQALETEQRRQQTLAHIQTAQSSNASGIRPALVHRSIFAGGAPPVAPLRHADPSALVPGSTTGGISPEMLERILLAISGGKTTRTTSDPDIDVTIATDEEDEISCGKSLRSWKGLEKGLEYHERSAGAFICTDRDVHTFVAEWTDRLRLRPSSPTYLGVQVTRQLCRLRTAFNVAASDFGVSYRVEYAARTNLRLQIEDAGQLMLQIAGVNADGYAEYFAQLTKHRRTNRQSAARRGAYVGIDATIAEILRSSKFVSRTRPGFREGGGGGYRGDRTKQADPPAQPGRQSAGRRTPRRNSNTNKNSRHPSRANSPADPATDQ